MHQMAYLYHVKKEKGLILTLTHTHLYVSLNIIRLWHEASMQRVKL